MITRSVLHHPNGNAIVKPLVVLAARCLGPGRLRLDMVKLAHDLSEGRGDFPPLHARSGLPQTMGRQPSLPDGRPDLSSSQAL